jgi:hypothetical protein
MKDGYSMKSTLLALVAVGIAPLICATSTARAQESAAEIESPTQTAPSPGLRYDVWVADSLERVAQEAEMPPDPATEVVVHCARGEFEAAQIAVHPKDDSIVGLRVMATELTSEGGESVMPRPRVRFVDSVPIRHNSWQTPRDELTAIAPAFVPDVLYDNIPYVPVWKGRTRCAWVTFDVPRDARHGTYTGKVTVFANEEQIDVPVILHVHDVTVPAERNLKMTNWVYLDQMARWHSCTLFDERFWQMVKVYAENMASHRQNMIIIPLYRFYTDARLVDFAADGGNLLIDFTKFDRWVQTFLDAGFEYIEGSHLGWIDGTVYCYFARDGQVVAEDHPADSPEAERYLSQFLPALQAHLEEKGWLDIYYQHLRDEPGEAHKALYDKLMELRRTYGPRIQTIEATHSPEIDPPTIMVPVLSHLHLQLDFYKQMQEKGQEVWFYTACGPNQTYANRFLDYHLLKVRYLHWLNFKYGIHGYLCWGYNYWSTLSPFTEHSMTWAVGPLPPGDSNIVYPTPRGLLDSIRWETLRDGIEDYELLKMLEAKDQAAAARICNSLVPDFDTYDLRVDRFREARLEILSALEK